MRPPWVAVVACLLLAAAVRLPGLGARGLGAAEQTAFVESRGFSATPALPSATRVVAGALPRHAGLLTIARHATVPPVHAVGLALWTRVAGTSERALRLPSALAGILAAFLAALVAGRLGGPRAAAWAGGLVALSPIHALASRAAGPESPLVLVLLAALAALVRVEESASRPAAVVLGLAAGILASSGPTAGAGVAVLAVAWPALRTDRRAPAGLAAVVALAVVVLAAFLGLARSPLDPGEIPSWVPETTASGILRCAGASFTRVAGLEYQLAVPQARYVLPLTALFVGLMALGRARLPARTGRFLVAGAALPFALGATLALVTSRVTPLQATRLLAALPFVAVLMATGLASLRGWRGWMAGAAVSGALVALLSLALIRPGPESSPTQAVAREVTRCLGGRTVVAVQRPLDLLALAAWDVPGPFVLRPIRARLPRGPEIAVGLSSACVSGGPRCGTFPACGDD